MYKCKQSCAFTVNGGQVSFELGKKYSKAELAGVIGAKEFAHCFKGEAPFFVDVSEEVGETLQEEGPKTSKKPEKKDEVADDARV